jgi:hypothetical protein
MAPRLGAQYPIEVETTSQPKSDYETDEWAETDLPCAPAVMIGDEIVAEGSDISEDDIVAEIRKQLGMPPLEPAKKGILRRLFGK